MIIYENGRIEIVTLIVAATARDGSLVIAADSLKRVISPDNSEKRHIVDKIISINAHLYYAWSGRMSSDRQGILLAFEDLAKPILDLDEALQLLLSMTQHIRILDSIESFNVCLFGVSKSVPKMVMVRFATVNSPEVTDFETFMISGEQIAGEPLVAQIMPKLPLATSMRTERLLISELTEAVNSYPELLSLPIQTVIIELDKV